MVGTYLYCGFINNYTHHTNYHKNEGQYQLLYLVYCFNESLLIQFIKEIYSNYIGCMGSDTIGLSVRLHSDKRSWSLRSIFVLSEQTIRPAGNVYVCDAQEIFSNFCVARVPSRCHLIRDICVLDPASRWARNNVGTTEHIRTCPYVHVLLADYLWSEQTKEIWTL